MTRLPKRPIIFNPRRDKSGRPRKAQPKPLTKPGQPPPPPPEEK